MPVKTSVQMSTALCLALGAVDCSQGRFGLMPRPHTGNFALPAPLSAQSIAAAEALLSLHLDVIQDLENFQADSFHKHDPLRMSCSPVGGAGPQTSAFHMHFSGCEAIAPETGERSLILTRPTSNLLSRKPLNPLQGLWSGFADHSRQPNKSCDAVGTLRPNE